MCRTPALLTDYARYHRDARNIATHCIGVPMITLAMAILLSRPRLDVAGVLRTPAWLVSLAAGVWYLTRGGALLGRATTALLASACWIGQAIAGAQTSTWLGSGVALFLIGWVIQFVGHHFEGRKLAFLDDLPGLLIGPMFAVVSAA